MGDIINHILSIWKGYLNIKQVYIINRYQYVIEDTIQFSTERNSLKPKRTLDESEF